MIASFNKRLFTALTISFIVATVIGTLTHECGHYLIARFLGYNATIHYSSTEWWQASPDQATDLSDGFWILLGGPLETILTGTIGIGLLFLFRKSFYNALKLSPGQWLMIFVSLFWLRQTANLAVWIINYFDRGNPSLRSDEVRLSKFFNMPDGTILTLTGIIGLLILTVIIFKFVPAKQRITFIISGLAGGLAGYYLWLGLLGKYLMP